MMGEKEFVGVCWGLGRDKEDLEYMKLGGCGGLSVVYFWVKNVGLGCGKCRG